MNIYNYDGYDIWFIKSRYVDGSLAIISCYQDDLYATITVCIDGEMLDVDCAYVDTDELRDIEDFLVSNKIAEPTGRTYDSDYCTYPEYRFNKKFLSDIEEY